MGFGLVDGPAQQPRHVASGTCTAPAAWSVARRLARLQQQLTAVFEEHQPSCVVLETSFHGKNSQALLRLGEARGVVIGLAGRQGPPVHDYSPAMIKKAVTGHGNAAKEAVGRMVRALLPGVPEDDPSDTTDAPAGDDASTEDSESKS